MTTLTLETLDQYLRTLLQPELFRDYAPNGIQIEGRPEIRRIVTGVSANQALIEAAIDRRADAILVHHGFFWDKEPRALTGYRGQRVKTIIHADQSLLAYHLPLDAHAEFGNNVEVIRAAGAAPIGTFGSDRPAIAWHGRFETPQPRDFVLRQLAQVLHQAPVAFLHGPAEVSTIGVVTGGGARWFEDALDLGIDLFISGEPSEQSQGIAAERFGNFAAFGHHATERTGIRALGAHLAKHFGIEVEFIDVHNPV